VLSNTGGSKITLTERINYQDGVRFGNPNPDSIGIDPGKSFTRPTFVCLASGAEHIFRTDWSGSDAAGNKIAATGPNVRLLKKP
jgi:hypothetical protein